MLSEFMSFAGYDVIKQYLDDNKSIAAIEVASGQSLPYFRLCLDTGNVILLTKEVIKSYKYYKIGTKNQVFIAKKNTNNTTPSDVHDILEQQKENVRFLSKKVKFQELDNFLELFDNLDLDSLKKTIFCCEEFDPTKDCYFTFDYEYPRIQTVSFFHNLTNACLAVSNKDEPIDAFGNYGTPVSGDFKIASSKTNKKEQLRVYAKNEKNKCYARYGISGNEAFPVSETTKNTISQILTFGLDNGILTSYDEVFGKNKKEYKIWGHFGSKDIAFLLKEYNEKEEEFGLEEFKTECSSTIDSIKNLKSYQGCSSIMVFKKNGHSQCSIVSNHATSNEKICELIEQWRQGITQTPLSRLPFGIKPPKHCLNFVILTKFLSQTAYLSSGSVVLANNHQWSICDSINLFFNSNRTNKAIRLIAKNCPYFSLKSKTRRNGKKTKFNSTDKTINEFNYFDYFLPVVGLILFKRGISMEDVAKTWAYKLGELFSLASEIQSFYCLKTGTNEPSEFHAERALSLAYKNPKDGLTNLIKSFNRPYLSWARKNARHSLQEWNRLISELSSVPERITKDEIIFLTQGKAVDMSYNAIKPLEVVV